MLRQLPFHFTYSAAFIYSAAMDVGVSGSGMLLLTYICLMPFNELQYDRM